jgi:hypothetical protein
MALRVPLKRKLRLNGYREIFFSFFPDENKERSPKYTHMTFL